MPDLKMPQINVMIISGRLTADPEIKHVGQDGTTVCNVSLATDSGWGDKKKPIFLDCTCWGKTAEIVGELKKGSPVVFEGRIHMEEWDDKKTGDKRKKIAMTVNRVSGLVWEGDRQGQQPPEQRDAAKGVPF